MARIALRLLRRRVVRPALSLLLGTALTLVGLELVLSLAYRGFAWSQRRENDAEAGREGEVRIVCIGESTTAVAGDETGTMLVSRTSYPAQLDTILNTRQSERHFRVLNNGIMGGTSGTALELLRQTLHEQRVDVIVAMMGIKDTPNEWVPLTAALPRWTDGLHTVQLASWVSEGIRLRRNANVTDIRTFDDLPPSAQEKTVQLGNYLREIRIADDAVAISQARAAIYLLRIGRVSQAEAIMRTLTEERDVGYSLLADILQGAGRHDQAAAVLSDAIARHPEDPMYSVVLADLLIRQKRHAEAREVLTAAGANQGSWREPELALPYVEMGLVEVLLSEGGYDDALARIEAIRPIVRIRYHDVLPPIRLLVAAARGRAYMGKRAWGPAEASLLEALEISPGRHSNMWLLSQVYRETGQTAKEEAVRWQLLETQGRVAEYFELAKLFRLAGQPERVPEVLASAVEHTPSLRANHAALYALAEQHGARLVVMQYPAFDLESLHLYAPPKEGVRFVDNLHVFDADPDGYFFEPTYPNSFSHYTLAGAGVLANHVADTILDFYAEAPAAEPDGSPR
ncbi:MAG: tetratricopeptide repeat protein [Deltaproteobacteria bacterium]|nr:tetratricopeptide repeat protein [Deltaproteobacteria bacterium]